MILKLRLSVIRSIVFYGIKILYTFFNNFAILFKTLHPLDRIWGKKPYDQYKGSTLGLIYSCMRTMIFLFAFRYMDFASASKNSFLIYYYNLFIIITFISFVQLFYLLFIVAQILQNFLCLLTQTWRRRAYSFFLIISYWTSDIFHTLCLLNHP